jgi:hypothetical protein
VLQRLLNFNSSNQTPLTCHTAPPCARPCNTLQVYSVKVAAMTGDFEWLVWLLYATPSIGISILSSTGQWIIARHLLKRYVMYCYCIYYYNSIHCSGYLLPCQLSNAAHCACQLLLSYIHISTFFHGRILVNLHET